MSENDGRCDACEHSYFRHKMGDRRRWCRWHPQLGRTEDGDSNLCWYQRKGGWFWARRHNECGHEGRFWRASVEGMPDE